MNPSTEPNPAQYTCHRATGPIRVDGRLDEPDWEAAPRSTPFVDIVTGEPAWFDTRVSLLWDDRALYFGFRAEETNLQASFTERDSKIWFDNDLEIFVAGRDAYFEFEINAFNTIYEVLWIWNDVLEPGGPYSSAEWDATQRPVMRLSGVGGHVHPRGERCGFLDWDFPGLEHAVRVDGTINSHADTDRGWTAEIALPWEGFRLMADGRQLPPRDGDIWRIDCSRFQSVDRTGKPFPAGEGRGWSWNRHGYYDSHIPEVFPYVRFSTRPAG